MEEELVRRSTICVTMIVSFLALSSSSTVAEKPKLNNDIVVTRYAPVVMEQGKSEVFPVFRIKNTGSRPYEQVQLRYDTPVGLSSDGKTVRLGLSTGRIPRWHSITLLPGQEVNFNPSLGQHISLSAATDQPPTVYSTKFHFRFKDEENQWYRTPPRKVEEFVKVGPFNNDIVVTRYAPVVMEQGKSEVFPVFRIKNTGSRPYEQVQLRYDTPVGLSSDGKTVRLGLSTGRIPRWHSITLLPGQEVNFNPSLGQHISLSAATDQPRTVYSTKFHFRFKDEENQWYRTPPRKVEEFVKVGSFNNDIVVTRYAPVVMEQGKSEVFPVFRIKNTGSRPYEQVQLRYDTPVGLSSDGKTVRLGLGTGRIPRWHSITLLPGQEVNFNPSLGQHISLSAATDQPRTVYSTKFHFRFKDEENQWYRTPPRKVEEFAYVGLAGDNMSPKVYSDAYASGLNKAAPAQEVSGTRAPLDLAPYRDRLSREIDRLQNIVHPSQLEELKRIRDDMRRSSKSSTSPADRRGATAVDAVDTDGLQNTLLTRIGRRIADKTRATLHEQYRNNEKWLAFFGMGAFDVVDVAMYIDLADYMGITGEGSGKGSDQGEKWVTVWVDGSAGLQVSLLPVSFGIVKLSFDPNEPDPRRRYRLSMGEGTLPGFSITSIERGEADDHPTWGKISFGTLSVSASIANATANLARFEVKKSVLDSLVESSFSREAAFLQSVSVQVAAARVVASMVKRDQTNGALRVVADGARLFSSSDDGPIMDRKYVDATFTRSYGGIDIDDDGLGDLRFPIVASLGSLPISGHDTSVEFQNIGNNASNFFVKVDSVPAGWLVWPLDGGNRIGDYKFDIANVGPGKTARSMWGIGASEAAPSVAHIRFRLYHDGILPLSAPWLGNKFLDEIVLVARKQ